MEPLCQTIAHHLELSRRALRASRLLEADNIIAQLLDDLTATVVQTRASVQEAQRFLDAYVAS